MADSTLDTRVNRHPELPSVPDDLVDRAHEAGLTHTKLAVLARSYHGLEAHMLEGDTLPLDEERALRNRWLDAEARELVGRRIRRMSDDDAAAAIANAKDLILELEYNMCFEINHALALGERLARFSSSRRKARRGGGVARNVGRKIKHWVTVADAPEAPAVERSRLGKIGLIIGGIAVVYALGNRLAVGLDHGLDEVFSLNHWDFGLFGSDTTSQAAAYVEDQEPDSSKGDQHGGGDNSGNKDNTKDNEHPDEPDTPEGQSDHTMSMEAGKYGQEGKPGSLGEFANLVLAEHGIDDPSNKQRSEVLAALIDSNDTYNGKQHWINAGQEIDLSKAHEVVDGFSKADSGAAESTPNAAEPDHPNLPKDWPAEAELATPDQLNDMYIDGGMGGEDYVQALGYEAADWYDAADKLYADHPDQIYTVTERRSDGTEFTDYRLKKRGYPSWSFLSDLLELLGNKSKK